MSEPLSLDAPLCFWSRSGGEDGPALYEFLNVVAPEVRSDVTGLREGLVELLDGLAPDEQLIVAAWFGLAGGRERTLTEIAEILTLTGNPISRTDVYAVLQTALQKLRAECCRRDRGHYRRATMTATIPALGQFLTVNDSPQITILQLALDQYAAKQLDAEQALELMAQQLAGIEEQLSPITALRDQARTMIGHLMTDAGLTKAATAHAQLMLIPDTTTESFDAARLNRLIGDLVARGHASIAAEIGATKKKGTRKGYLMVKPNRE